MKKKILVVLLLLMILGASQSFAIGVGAAIGIDPLGSLPSNVMFSFKPPMAEPILFGLAFTISNNNFSIAATADYWMYHAALVGPVSIYVGPGVYMAVSGSQFDLGLRLPVGFQVFPIKPLEIFLEVAPTVKFLPSFPNFGLQGSFGARFWF